MEYNYMCLYQCFLTEAVRFSYPLHADQKNNSEQQLRTLAVKFHLKEVCFQLQLDYGFCVGFKTGQTSEGIKISTCFLRNGNGLKFYSSLFAS